MAKKKKVSKKAATKRSTKRGAGGGGARGSASRGDELPPHRCCGTDEVHERLLRTAPRYREMRDACENHAFRASLAPMAQRTGCTKIPVVVHVLYNSSATNISDAQIDSQIDVLNEDFRMKNADVSSVPTVFKPLTGDARIEFELAKEDPKGNPTTGIVRKSTTKSQFSSATDDIKFSSKGGSDAWPRDEYLNIWVGPRIVNSSGGSLLGYAQFPGGPADTDGVVILHSAFGTTGTAAAPFDKGRTTTHEVGHWLNLRHIWGDDGTGCSGSDFVADTPNQAGPNYGKPTFPSVSCSNGPNGDLFMNYMDYVDDAAMIMFTNGQVTRMQAALDGPRSTLGTSTPCVTKALPKDGPKDPLKEFHKDGPKDFPKDIIKDPPKDFPKDIIKDFPKDGAKEFPKDGPKDLPFDPVKTYLEPPVNLPGSLLGGLLGTLGLGGTGAPGGPGGLGGLGGIGGLGGFGGFGFRGGAAGAGGGVPFVLGTPAGAGYGAPGGCGCGGAANAEVLRQQLMQLAQLQAYGLLDVSGLAAWQAAAQAYQRMAGAQGMGWGA